MNGGDENDPETQAQARAPMDHVLKIDPAAFQAAQRGEKTSELRRNDRNYRVRDRLVLMETVHTGEEMAAGAALAFTGRVLTRTVTHVQSGYGLQDGWVSLSHVSDDCPPRLRLAQGWHIMPKRLTSGMLRHALSLSLLSGLTPDELHILYEALCAVSPAFQHDVIGHGDATDVAGERQPCDAV